MKSRLNYLVFLLFTFIVGANATENTKVVESDDYFKQIGLAVKPLHVSVEDGFREKCLEGFKKFQESKNTHQEKVWEFQIVRAFALSILNIPVGAFTDIECRISKTQTPINSMGRSLTVSYDVLAEILSSKCTHPVTQSALQERVALSKLHRQTAERFETLQYFAYSVLKYLPGHLEVLRNWTLGNSGTLMLYDLTPHLECDFNTILNFVSDRAKRDIRLEFEGFERDYNEKKTRVLLNEELNQYMKDLGEYYPFAVDRRMYLPPSTFSEALWISSMDREVVRRALPKEYDISTSLMQMYLTLFQSLTSQMDDRFRAFGRFVVCRQETLLKETVSREYQKISLVNFQAGRLMYQEDGEIVNTEDTIWALNPEGVLCIFPKQKGKISGLTRFQHSYFFQKDDVGTPLACAGHIQVRLGKISKITPNSGHYKPSILQLLLVLAYLQEKDVLADDLILDLRPITLLEQYGYSVRDLIRMASMLNLSDV